MSGNRYNGWTNWETWNFKLWLDNDMASHYSALDMMVIGNGVYEYARALETMAWDMRDDVLKDESGFFADACNNAIKEINFFEIAEAYIDDVHNDPSR